MAVARVGATVAASCRLARRRASRGAPATALPARLPAGHEAAALPAVRAPQSSSLDFLARCNFDFNKCIHHGISYLPGAPFHPFSIHTCAARMHPRPTYCLRLHHGGHLGPQPPYHWPPSPPVLRRLPSSILHATLRALPTSPPPRLLPCSSRQVARPTFLLAVGLRDEKLAAVDRGRGPARNPIHVSKPDDVAYVEALVERVTAWLLQVSSRGPGGGRGRWKGWPSRACWRPPHPPPRLPHPLPYPEPLPHALPRP
jgi:hypothetical protein